MVYLILQHKMLRYTDKRTTQQQVSTKRYNSFGHRWSLTQEETQLLLTNCATHCAK